MLLVAFWSTIEPLLQFFVEESFAVSLKSK